MPPFKDESLIIISPGSQCTLAQLGLPESFTPPTWRFPTRMFPSPKAGEWEPTKIRKAEPITPAVINGNTVNGAASQDVVMGDDARHDSPVETIKADAAETAPVEAAPAEAVPAAPAETAEVKAEEGPAKEVEIIYEEDPTSTEGAVYPLVDGQIDNWPCFLALLTHIFNTLSPPFHTPVLVISQPCWSARDHENLTQFFFETFKIPAFCLMDAALAACYAYGVQTATVVDVGHGKCDVTAVLDFMVCDTGRGAAISGLGGQGMTRRLLQLLEKQGFDENMCEQLKRSAICEILSVDEALPGEEPNQDEMETEVVNPAAAASTGAADSGAEPSGAPAADGSKIGTVPRGPGEGTEVGEEGVNEDDVEGVLDVASIVARGNASEILAKREKEKLERQAQRKAAGAEAAKPSRLKNSEKVRASFVFEDYEPVEEGGVGARVRKRKRDVSVGVERFMAVSAPKLAPAEGGILEAIAATVHRTILAVPEVSARSSLWENLIILGNGSRVKGFTAALLSTLGQKYTLSPSNATIFTSEIPSNISTPMPTGGTNTPNPNQPPHPMHHPAGHGVNPLLVAATHANQSQNQHLPAQQQSLHIPGQEQLHPQLLHRGHNQTPTHMKLVKSPEYFPEWKDPHVAGMEEAGFLGAQVAAKVVFVVDQGISKGFLTRADYNELGPGGIRECAM